MSEDASRAMRLRVAVLSIVAGATILGLKYVAFLVSGSAALKSDAIESVVNVVAAVFALGAVLFAEKPADREHPYGHGKIEHFSAAFEGGLIALAAVLIWYEALDALYKQWHGAMPIKDLGKGLLINISAGLLNGLLGVFLLRMGRRHHSKAIEADGHHVLSDFWTSCGLAVGLVLVKVTGALWLDPLMAMAVGTLLAITGFKLVRHSSQALLDMEDPAMLERLVDSINRVKPREVVAVHELRTLRSGRYTHVDIHLVLPEYLTVAEGHHVVEAFNAAVMEDLRLEGEFHSHTDPCERAWCRTCAVDPCPIRVAPCERPSPLTLETATGQGAI